MCECNVYTEKLSTLDHNIPNPVEFWFLLFEDVLSFCINEIHQMDDSRV